MYCILCLFLMIIWFTHPSECQYALWASLCFGFVDVLDTYARRLIRKEEK